MHIYNTVSFVYDVRLAAPNFGILVHFYSYKLLLPIRRKRVLRRIMDNVVVLETNSCLSHVNCMVQTCMLVMMIIYSCFYWYSSH